MNESIHDTPILAGDANPTLLATATFGLEAVVAGELRRLGYDPHIGDDGRIRFSAGLDAVPRANLWLRAADRVLIEVGSFPARTFDQLFEGTKALPWADWLPAQAAFPVIGKCVRSQLMSVPDCQSIVKKAVVERLKAAHGLSWFPEDGPVHRIEVAVVKDRASLTLDTTGPGLHKRGYRPVAAPAPLKETLAAGLLLLARWRPSEPLLDPFCGSGTIAIEAALLGRNVAPGIRRRFAAEEWPAVPAALWTDARQEAADLAEPGQPLEIHGTDLDPAAVELAERHAALAGTAREISFAAKPVSAWRLAGTGTLIGNPPYGERIGDREAVEGIARALGRLSRSASGWSCHILSAQPNFERLFGRRADRRRKLYNGRIECQYYSYQGLLRC